MANCGFPVGGSIGNIPLCRLDGLGQVGPDVRRLSDGFDRTSSVTAYPLVEGHDTGKRRSLTCSPDGYLSPLTMPRGGQRPGYGERLWQQSSRLLIGARFRLNTARIVAMLSETAVLSRMWWPIQAARVSFEKSLGVWLNSSLGLLTLMAIRNTTQGSWVQLKKADLEAMSVLDLRRLSPAQRQGSVGPVRRNGGGGVRASAGVWPIVRRGAAWTGVFPRYSACRTWVSYASCWRRSRWCLAGGCRGTVRRGFTLDRASGGPRLSSRLMPVGARMTNWADA